MTRPVCDRQIIINGLRNTHESLRLIVCCRIVRQHLNGIHGIVTACIEQTLYIMLLHNLEYLLLPERVFDIDKFVADVKELAANKSSVVIAVSEGVKVADGRYVCEIGREVAVDAFGHKQMSGTAVMLADKIAAETGLKTRAIEFSTLQRAAICACAALVRIVTVSVQSDHHACLALVCSDNSVR